MPAQNCTLTCNSYSPGYESEAPLVYLTYLFTATGSLVLSFSLFISQYFYRCLYPYSILTHLTFILSVHSFLYIANGLSYLFKQQINETGVHCYSFGLSFSCCPVESTLQVFCSISFVAWNLAWVFDLIKAYKQPSHDTRKFGVVYSIFVYVAAGLYCAISFEFKETVYAMGRMYTCSIATESYTYTLNFLYFTYPLIAIVAICIYGRSDAVPYFHRNKEALLSNFGVKMRYVVIFTTFRIIELILDFFNTPKSRQSYAIMQSLEPAVLMLPWTFAILKSFFCGGQSQSPASLAIRPKDPHEPLLTILKHEEVRKNTTDPKKVTEYLLKGIQRVEIVSPAFPQLPAILNESQNSGMIQKAIKKFCGWCFEEPDEYDYYEPAQSLQNSMIMGYPGAFNENGIIDKNELLKEARTQHVVTLPLVNVELIKNFTYEEEYVDNANKKGIRFISLAPKLFESIRAMGGINYDEFLQLFNIDTFLAGDLQIHSENFYISHKKGEYIVKAINKGEYELLKKILHEKYTHYLMNPNTYLWPILGCYSMEINEGSETGTYFFIVQKTMIESRFKDENVSWVAFYGKNARMVNTNMYVKEKALPLGSSELFDKSGRLTITRQRSERITSQLLADSAFLAKHSVVGYGLGTAIIDTPFNTSLLNPSEPALTYPSPRTRKNGSGLRTLKLQQDKTGGEKEYLILEEWVESEESSCTVKEIYLIVNPADIDAIRKLSSSKGSVTRTIINFQSIVTTYSLKEYEIALDKAEMVDSDEPRRDSFVFLLPEANQVIRETEIPEEEEDAEEEGQLRRKSSYASHRGSDLANNFGLLELKEFGQGKDQYSNMIFQLVFDSIKGRFYKRQIRFGLLEYLNAMANWTVSRGEAEDYRATFIESVRKVFQ